MTIAYQAKPTVWLKVRLGPGLLAPVLGVWPAGITLDVLTNSPQIVDQLVWVKTQGIIAGQPVVGWSALRYLEIVAMNNTSVYILDDSHWNKPDLGLLKAAGVFGIIHKATNGATGVDIDFKTSFVVAKAAGFAVGAYHFGTGDDPIEQEANFSRTVQPDAQTVIALDLESNRGYGSSMNIQQAETFCQRIFDRYQRWPVVYTAQWYLSEIMGADTPTLLSNCPLWVASYQPQPLIPRQWKTWTLWQFTDGQFGPAPHHLPGLPQDLDLNYFNGDLIALKQFWNLPA